MRKTVASVVLAALVASGCQSTGRYGTLLASGDEGTSAEPVACSELIRRTQEDSRTHESSRADWLELGSTSASRALVARMLRDMSSSDPVSSATADLAVRCLSALYGLRSQRQQTWMDSGARVSFLAALGAALTKGTTQNSWAGIAIFPAMLGQAEAFHPTRSLFSSAEASLEALVARYSMAQHILDQAGAAPSLPDNTQLETICAAVRIDVDMSVLLEAAREEVQAARTAALQDCHNSVGRVLAARAILERVAPRPGIAAQEAVPEQVAQREVPALPAGTPDRREGTDTPVPVREAQPAVPHRPAQVAVPAIQARSNGNILLTRRLLCDALYIDTQVVQRDQQMRTTPEMAAGRLLSSPLRALDSIFTKADTISPERLRTTMALEDFEVRYTGIPELKLMADSLTPVEGPDLVRRIAELSRPQEALPTKEVIEGLASGARAAVEKEIAERASNQELLRVLIEIRKGRAQFENTVSAANAVIGGLNAAFAHFGNLATPTGVRFKYNVGEQRFNLEPLPADTAASATFMQSHCR